MSKKSSRATTARQVAANTTADAPETRAHGGGRAHIMSDRVWLVLARRAYDEPLRQVGTVEADDIELARVYARSIYEEFAWVDMVAVPRDAVINVIES